MPATPAGLVRRFALLSALRWFPIGLTIPVNILLMQARGLDLAAIGGLYAIYGVVTIALELPTGGLADVMGRRTVLVAAAVATTVSMLIAAFAQDAPMFALALTLAATGRALGSGPLDAWYVDATHAIDPEASVRHGLSRGQAAEALALGLGAIIGGLLPAICLSIWPSLTSGPIIGLSGMMSGGFKKIGRVMGAAFAVGVVAVAVALPAVFLYFANEFLGIAVGIAAAIAVLYMFVAWFALVPVLVVEDVKFFAGFGRAAALSVSRPRRRRRRRRGARPR